MPGVIHGTSGSQAEKNFEFGNDSCKAWTKIPIIRPKVAPIAIDGTKIPAGTLQPYDMMTRRIRRTVAIAREKAIDHRLLALKTRQGLFSSMMLL